LQTLLILAEVFIAAALIIFVLLQRSEGGALGMGGGGSGLGGLFSPRGAADTLTRTTAILAALFFLTCIALNLLSLKGRNEKSILDSPVTTTSPASTPAKPAPPSRAPQVPSVPTPH
jgi:preprotein translocase subunit SecG